MDDSCGRCKKILLIDDDQIIRQVLKNYLEQSNYIVYTARDAGDGLKLLKSTQPDLLLLDLWLPDQDGLELARWIRSNQAFFALPIIMLTARVEPEDRVLGLEVGADDYVIKPFNSREVVARVKALLRRQHFISDNKPVIRVGCLELDIGRREFRVDGKEVALTPIEYRILQTLLQNPGFTYTREELQAKATGSSYKMSGRTLDTHIRNLRQKVEQNPKQPKYIQTIYSIGYRMANPIESCC